jgi:hypothetical protein
MKLMIRIAGACLVSMLAMSMALATSASAALHWLVCLAEHSGTTTTKWKSSQCTTAGPAGGFEWSEVTGTEAVKSESETITLRDKKATGGSTAVQCTGITNEGSVGPGKFDRITKVTITASKCARLENSLCESVVEVKAVNLPWQTELEETENKILDIINNTGTSGKEPGWAVTCETLIGPSTDTCEGEGTAKQELLLLANKPTNGELLVLATFEEKRKATCSQGGSEQGEVKGSVAILGLNRGLAVSK